MADIFNVDQTPASDQGPSNDYSDALGGDQPLGDGDTWGPHNYDQHPLHQFQQPANPSNVGGQPTVNGAPLQDYDTFSKNRLKAFSDWAYQNTGLLGHLGMGQEAVKSYAEASMPAKYAQYRQQHAAAQSAELGVGQDVALLNQGGYNVDPNNIPASLAQKSFIQSQAAAQSAAQAAAQQQQQAAPNAAAQPAPQAGAPDTGIAPPVQPAAAGVPVFAGRKTPGMIAPAAAPGQNPAEAQRAFIAGRAAGMVGLPKYATTGAALLGQVQDTGMPGTTVDFRTGAIIDKNTGQPVTDQTGRPINAQQYAARGAGMTAGAEANARLPATIAAQNNDASLRMGHTVTDENGNKVPISDFQLAVQQAARAKAGAPPLTEGIADNPYREGHIKQINKVVDDANGADQMQQAVDEMGQAVEKYGAAGPLSKFFQPALEHLNQVGLLDKDGSEKVQAGALANMDSNTVAAGMARQLTQGGRMLAGVFNQVQKAKPNLLQSDPRLALEALHQEMQRQKDMGAFIPQYYAEHGKSPTAASFQEAKTAFDKAHPVAQYESYVLPKTMPKNRADLQEGYAYKLNDGRTGVFSSGHMVIYKGLGRL